jgi:hypothetical protein
MKDSARDFILDCEAVAWDPIGRKLLPFQELSKRKRKDVKKEDITIQVQIFAFDILYCNGEVRFSLPCLSLVQYHSVSLARTLSDRFRPNLLGRSSFTNPSPNVEPSCESTLPQSRASSSSQRRPTANRLTRSRLSSMPRSRMDAKG